MKSDGGSAFPAATSSLSNEANAYPRGSAGMSLWDYFAGQALIGLLAADGNDPRWTGKDTGPEYQRGGGKWLDPSGVSMQAADIADAVLKVREARRG